MHPVYPHHRLALGYGSDITWAQCQDVVRRLWRRGGNGRPGGTP